MSMDLDFGSGSGISGGPTYLNRSCMMMRMNKAAAGSGCGYGGLELPADAIRKQQQQQPFDSVSKFPGSGMAMEASAGAHSMSFFPFTNAQWNELERQAMVFKYMMHSIPVPYELLFPFLSAASNLSDPSGNMRRDTHLLKFLKNGDPEPGRCRRTDGKKWRCSNGVALDQKYCEKHVHRGRPRSRKHVEANPASDLNKTNKKSCLGHNRIQSNVSPQVSVSKPIASPLIGVGFNNDQLARSTAGFTNAPVQFPASSAVSVASLFPPSQMRNGDFSEEQWNQMIQFQQQQLSLNSCTQPKQDPQEINLFLNLDHLKKPTSTILDAWTVANNDNSSNRNHDLVSLGLSMGHGYNKNDDANHGENKQEQLHVGNWMTQSGGPLGEVLRPNVTRSSSPSSAEVILECAAASPTDGTILTSTPPTFPSQTQSGIQCLIQEKIIKHSST